MICLRWIIFIQTIFKDGRKEMGKTLNYEVTLGDLAIAIDDRQLGDDELLKQKYGVLGGAELKKELEDSSKPDVEEDVHIHLKPHGIYIQFDRGIPKQKEKDWTFMVRSSVWGGGEISRIQWMGLSSLADLYSSDDDGEPSMRLTTRQSIQFHHVKKENLLKLVQGLIDINKPTLNGCGDNVRNVVACPHRSEIFNPQELAHKIAQYFQLPYEEYLKIFYPGKEYVSNSEEHFEYDIRGLPRKFKIAIGGYYYDEEAGGEVRCNCPDVLSNDVGIVPLIKDKKVIGYQLYIGGGLGQKNTKATFATLGVPFGIFNTYEELIAGLDAIVRVQQQIGDRAHRHWARFKNVLIKKGLEAEGKTIDDLVLQKEDIREIMIKGAEWFRGQTAQLDVKISLPVDIELGELNRHHGWSRQNDWKYSYGLWIQNGRLTNTNPQGKVKDLVDNIVREINPTTSITPYQDILFTNITAEGKKTIEKLLADFGCGNYSRLRMITQACVGLNTCSIAVAESERYFQPLLTELEESGYGNTEGVSIGISGCERHCSRNVRHDISIEGKGMGIYQIKLMLGDVKTEVANDLLYNDRKYLRCVLQCDIPGVIKALIDNYTKNRLPEETSMSLFHKRIGVNAILEYLKRNSETAKALDKTYDASLV